MRTRVPALIGLILLAGAASCTKTRAFTVPNSAMEPTIISGEKFAAEMKPFQPLRGDLVIFQHEGVLLVKRVIGVSGDTVEGRDLHVFVNDKRVDEPYIQHIGSPSDSLVTFGPVIVPADRLFVAGDNRDFSFDSRDKRFGLISIADVKGKPLQIAQSQNPERMGKVVH